MAPRERDTEHEQSQDSTNTIKVKHPAFFFLAEMIAKQETKLSTTLQSKNQKRSPTYGLRREKPLFLSSGFANRKGADQPAHTRNLVSAFVIRLFESIVSKLATIEFSIC